MHVKNSVCTLVFGWTCIIRIYYLLQCQEEKYEGSWGFTLKLIYNEAISPSHSYKIPHIYMDNYSESIKLQETYYIYYERRKRLCLEVYIFIINKLYEELFENISNVKGQSINFTHELIFD